MYISLFVCITGVNTTAGLSMTKPYLYFGEFIDDLKRIFENAIKYNEAHRVSDTTGFLHITFDSLT